jgi:hypothetical protein
MDIFNDWMIEIAHEQVDLILFLADEYFSLLIGGVDHVKT